MWWHCWRSFPGGAVVKNPPADAGDASDTGSTPGLGRSPGGSNGTPLQYSCLENPWQAIFHRVVKSQTWLRARVRTYTHSWRSGEMSWLFSQKKPAMTQNYPIPCDPGACVHFPCVLPLLARHCISLSLLSSVPSFPAPLTPTPESQPDKIVGLSIHILISLVSMHFDANCSWGFPGGTVVKGPQAKEHEQALEAEKGREADCFLLLPEGMQPTPQFYSK